MRQYELSPIWQAAWHRTTEVEQERLRHCVKALQQLRNVGDEMSEQILLAVALYLVATQRGTPKLARELTARYRAYLKAQEPLYLGGGGGE